MHKLLRLSVEASPDAPVNLQTGDTEPGRPPPAAPPAPKSPVPVCAVSTPQANEALAAGLIAKANPAEWTFDRLCRMIEDFESRLSPEEEVGAAIVGAPGEGAFHVDDIGFWGPDMIMFYGKNVHGRRVRLIQHYQQLSILLTALPREPERPARRIGFALRTRLEDAAAPNAPPAPEGAPEAGAPVAAPLSAGGGERP